MPLGRVIAETMADLRDRVEVSWHHDTWHVTASSFESALNYVETRFEDAAVLARRDHGRRWPRVTLEVSTDPALATKAPPRPKALAAQVVQRLRADAEVVAELGERQDRLDPLLRRTVGLVDGAGGCHATQVGEGLRHAPRPTDWRREADLIRAISAE